MSIASEIKDLHGDDIGRMVRDAVKKCNESDYDEEFELVKFLFDDGSVLVFSNNWNSVVAKFLA